MSNLSVYSIVSLHRDNGVNLIYIGSSSADQTDKNASSGADWPAGPFGRMLLYEV